jgi:hypothetical protein
LARRARKVQIKVLPVKLAPGEVLDRFTKATAVLLRIADRLEQERKQLEGTDKPNQLSS